MCLYATVYEINEESVFMSTTKQDYIPLSLLNQHLNAISTCGVCTLKIFVFYFFIREFFKISGTFTRQ